MNFAFQKRTHLIIFHETVNAIASQFARIVYVIYRVICFIVDNFSDGDAGGVPASTNEKKTYYILIFIVFNLIKQNDLCSVRQFILR